jgi:hypothetical protein
MACPSYPPRLDYSNYTWRRVQIMKLLIMQFSLFTRHLIPLRSKYPPQHPVLKMIVSKNCIIGRIIICTQILILEWLNRRRIGGRGVGVKGEKRNYSKCQMGKHNTDGLCLDKRTILKLSGTILTRLNWLEIGIKWQASVNHKLGKC